MAHTPPIKISSLEKTGVFKESRFFGLLSAENNYMSVEGAKDFYNGFIRVIYQELRKNGVVHLPGIGYFATVKQKPSLGLTGKIRTHMEGKYMVKFYSTDKFREYFTQLSKRPGAEGKLDPREKLLNMDLL